MNSIFFNSIALLALVGLAGCGGGGGGGAAIAPVVATPVTSSGRALFLSGPVTSPTFTTRSTSNGQPIAITESNGTASTVVSGTLADGSPVTALTNVPSAAITVPGRGYATSDQRQLVILQDVLGSASLANSSVVTHVVNPATGSAQFGYGHVGNAATNMPTTGTATYTGGYEGFDTANGRVTGNAQLTANFGANTVNGAISGVKPANSSLPALYGLNFSGTTTGTSFFGTTTLTGAAPSIPTTTTASGLTGGFYGPGAAEATGAVMAVGTVNGASTQVVGGFGTKK